MVVRTWRGQTTRDNRDAYVRHVTQNVFPKLKSISGHRGAYLLQKESKDRVEFLVLTMWESMQAVRAFAGKNVDQAVVEPEARAVLAEFDVFVNHYELVHDSVGPK